MAQANPSAQPAAARPAPSSARFALWDLGFRPFYLLAGLFAVLTVPLWVAQYAGWLSIGGHLSGTLWHAHEMIFGYALAVIAGFLLTAVRNWTNSATATGAALAALAALWLAGRILVLTPHAALAMWVDAAFPLALAFAIAAPLLASGNRRNYFFIGLLVAMALANLAFHGVLRGMLQIPAQLGLQLGLDVILFIMAVVGGRVIPMFTNNAIAGAGAARRPSLERLALGSVIALFVVDLAQGSGVLLAVVTGIAALAHGARLALWRPWRTYGRALVWILHLSYAWIVVHLAMRACAALALVPPPLSVHALTIGAIGGLTLGMMTRTARGHTARPLQAGPTECACYVLIQLAAAIRVFVPLVAPSLYFASVWASGLAWTVAFALFVIAYWPVLSRPRLDGAPG